MHLKLLQKNTSKNSRSTGDSIGNKIADKIAKILKDVQQNNSEAITNEDDNEIPKEKYISPEEIQKIIDDLRLI